MATKQSIPKVWFKKFSKTKKVKIVKFNPRILKLVEEFSTKLAKLLGKRVEIEHRGSTALGISGHGEVDLYLRVKNRKDFQGAFAKLKKRFGEPGSYYPREPRARFNYVYKGVEFEQMLVLHKTIDEIEGRLFFYYLKSHTELLPEYEAIKRKYAKVSKYKYQIEKHKFIHNVLRLARKSKN
jgi:GrpB-like predicted nucleotidyltransferase (UPF0157 family)